MGFNALHGSHTFTLTASDDCGNTAVANATYTADNVPDHATQVGVDGHIVIPPQKPDAAQLLAAIVQVEVKQAQVIRTPPGGKVVETGVIHVLVPYVADLDDQAVYAVEMDFPFQAYVPWPELPAGTRWRS